MYMSYCRFEGTLMEMRACVATVQEHMNEEAEYEVPETEIKKFCQMVNEFYSFLVDAELIDEDGCLDEEKLDEVCAAMETGYDCSEY